MKMSQAPLWAAALAALVLLAALGSACAGDDGNLDFLAANIEDTQADSAIVLDGSFDDTFTLHASAASATSADTSAASNALEADLPPVDKPLDVPPADKSLEVPLAEEEPAVSAAVGVDASRVLAAGGSGDTSSTPVDAKLFGKLTDTLPKALFGPDNSTIPSMPPALRGSVSKLLSVSVGTDEQAEERKDQEAASYIQGRLAKMVHTESVLREELAGAMRWGSNLQDTLVQDRKAMAAEKHKIQQVLVSRAKESARVLAAARRHEQTLEDNLKNTTRALVLRSQLWAQARQQLKETNRSLETAQKSFLATVSQLKKDQVVESTEVAKQEAEIQSLRAAKAAHEGELSHLKAEHAQTLAAAAQQLRKARGGQQLLQQQLAREHLREQRLQLNLKNATRSVAAEGRSLMHARHDLRVLNSSFEAAKQSWQRTEVQMRFDQVAEAQQVSTQENNLQWLRAAKASEDAELKTVKAQRDKDLKEAHDALLQERQRGLQMQRALEQERSTASANERMFKEEVTREVRRAQQNKAGEEVLRSQINELQNFSRIELGKLAAQLQAMKRSEAQLLKERSALRKQLEGNASRVMNLSAEVALANSHTDKDDALLRQAEEREKKAQAEMLAAKAVAKQLSGTVPQLLEQERLAHEQEEAEKAMRAQAQTQAKLQIDRLEQQYTTLVQGQINQLVTKPASSSASGSGADKEGIAEDVGTVAVDQVASLDSAEPANVPTESEDLPEDLPEEQPLSMQTAQPPRAPDLASDSHSLKQLLSQDGDDQDVA